MSALNGIRKGSAASTPLIAVARLYAAFGSFNDLNPGRGWLLGWTAVNGSGGLTLVQLPDNLLLNTQPISTETHGGSSIWGYGIASAGGYSSAAAASGLFGVFPFSPPEPELFFATGNDSGPHDGVTVVSESVVRVSGTDASVIGLFTPTNVTLLDQKDCDLGSGGVMLLPRQSGSLPNLAVVGGKDGDLYFLNRDALLGTGSNGGANSAALLDPSQKGDVYMPNSCAGVQGTPAQTSIQLGACLCGPSYFTGADGINRIVTSQGASSGDGSSLITYTLVLSPSAQPKLKQDGSAPLPGHNAGFFTVVSSNGTQAGSAIIWAVTAQSPTPPATNYPIFLYAFNAAAASDGTLNPLFPPMPAGAWPGQHYNATVVPVVANGKVFVASHGELLIFGLQP